MRHWLKRVWPFTLVAMAGILFVLTLPHLMSAYYLEAGGRALDDPSQARKHLQKAIEWQPSNAQAYRLLGQALQREGDWLAAVEALEHYIGLRPDNPLGHIELAEIYEAIDKAQAAMLLVDLLAWLPQAEVEVPEAPTSISQTQTSHLPWTSYLLQTESDLPSDSYDPAALFMQPPSSVTYRLVLPPQPAMLRFELLRDPPLQHHPGESIIFEVLLDGEQIFSNQFDYDAISEGWQQHVIDLAPWAGQEIALTLAVTPGPGANTSADQAGWGEPYIVDARISTLDKLRPQEQALREWRLAGLSAQDFLYAGENARRGEEYEKADEFYERATRLEPDWEEPYRLLAGTAKGDEMAVSLLRAGGLDTLKRASWLRPIDLYVNFFLRKNAQQSGDLASVAAYGDRLASFPLEAIDPEDERLLDYLAEVIPTLLEEGLWSQERTHSAISFLVRQHGEASSIDRLLHELMARYPSEPTWPFYLGELHLSREDSHLAADAYRQTISVDPTYVQAYLQLGRNADTGAQEELVDAVRWYSLYQEAAPRDLLVIKRLAELCAQMEERGQEDETCTVAAKRVLEHQGSTSQEVDRGSAAELMWKVWLDQVASIDPQFPVGQEIDGDWTFLGYDVNEPRLVRGEPVGLILYWQGPAGASAGVEQDGWYQAGDRWAQVLEAAQSLLPNGDFELGIAGFPRDIYDADPATRQFVTDERDGQRTTAAMLDNSDTHDSTSFVSEHLPIDQEGLFLQSGWIKSLEGNGYLGHRWTYMTQPLEEGTNPYSYVAEQVTADYWQHAAGIAQPLPGATYAQVWLTNYKSAGQVLFDDVAFVRIDKPGESGSY